MHTVKNSTSLIGKNISPTSKPLSAKSPFLFSASMHSIKHQAIIPKSAIHLPNYDIAKNYKLTKEEFEMALKNIIANKKNCSIQFLRCPAIDGNPVEMTEFITEIKQIQAQIKPNEIKFAYLFVMEQDDDKMEEEESNSQQKITEHLLNPHQLEDSDTLQHAEMVIISRKALFSPISFSVDNEAAEYASPFVSFFNEVNINIDNPDFLQASSTLCHSLCLHVTKAIINDNETMRNINRLNIPFKLTLKNQNTQEVFIDEFRNVNMPLLSRQVQAKIALAKQSYSQGNLRWSKIAFNYRSGKNIDSNNANQKLAHLALKTKFNNYMRILDEYANDPEMIADIKEFYQPYQRQFSQLTEYKSHKPFIDQ